MTQLTRWMRQAAPRYWSPVKVVEGLRARVDGAADDGQLLINALRLEAVHGVPRRVSLEAVDQVQPTRFAVPAKRSQLINALQQRLISILRAVTGSKQLRGQFSMVRLRCGDCMWPLTLPHARRDCACRSSKCSTSEPDDAESPAAVPCKSTILVVLLRTSARLLQQWPHLFSVDTSAEDRSRMKSAVLTRYGSV